jgi:acetolactate decarboxylase
MKNLPPLFTALALIAALVAARPAVAADRDTLFQYSTIDSLLAGLYDGDLTVADIRTLGNFGLGTFNGLDGEMIVLDSAVFQAQGEGVVRRASPTTGVPFTSVTFFDADKTAALPAGVDIRKLEALLDELAPNQNIYHAIRIDGAFDKVSLRVAPKQNKPYAPLAEIISQQTTFELTDVKGTLVGIRAPKYLTGLNVPGYHFHFVTANRSRGGHVFEIKAKLGTIQIDNTAKFTVSLPSSKQFAKLDLGKEREAEMRKVEKAQGATDTPKEIAPKKVVKVAPQPAPVPIAIPMQSAPTRTVAPVASPPVVATAAPMQPQPTQAVGKKSSNLWTDLLKCKDDDLPSHMRLRKQRHKAARRPASKSRRCD